jgi:hypothetical protein
MPLQIRRGTDAERTAMTQPLAAGELIFVTNTNRLYIGNGTTNGGVPVTDYTDEQARDATAPMLVNGTHSAISFVYDDALDKVNATVNLSDYQGVIKAAAFNGSVVANDSSLLIDGNTGKFNLSGRVGTDIIPDTDVAYDLGSATYRFRDLYLSGSSIKLGAATITAVGDAVNLPLGSTMGGVPLAGGAGSDYNGNIIGDDSTIIVNAATKVVTAAGGFIGNVTGTVTGNAGSVTNGVYITDTGTVTNTMLAGSIADTKLSTISTAGKVSNSATTATNANTASAIVSRDGSGNFLAGTITSALIGNVTGNTYGVVTGTAGSSLLGNVTGNVTGNINGVVTGTAGSSLLGNVTGNVTGYLTGDVKGSVFAEDSTLMVDATSGNINAGLLTVTTRIDVDNIQAAGISGLNVRSDGTTPLSITGIGTLGAFSGQVYFNINAAKGTLATPTTTAAGDRLGGLAIQGFTGSTYKTAGAVIASWEAGAVISDTFPKSNVSLVAYGGGSSTGDIRVATFDSQGVFAAPVLKPGVYATTAARDAAITAPAAGMMIFLTVGTKFQGYTGAAWVDLN